MDYDKEKDRKVNVINFFLNITIRNDIFRNIDFIKRRDINVGTHSICKYATTSSRRSD